MIALFLVDGYSLSEYSAPMDEFRQWVELRGQVGAARVLGRTQGTVSKWLSAGEVPGEACPQVAMITGIERSKLNPRLYA